MGLVTHGLYFSFMDLVNLFMNIDSFHLTIIIVNSVDVYIIDYNDVFKFKNQYADVHAWYSRYRKVTLKNNLKSVEALHHKQ